MECTNTQRSANQKKKMYNSETLEKKPFNYDYTL